MSSFIDLTLPEDDIPNGVNPEDFFTAADGVSDSYKAKKVVNSEDSPPVVLSPEQDKVLQAVRGGRNVFYSGPAVSPIFIPCVPLEYLI